MRVFLCGDVMTGRGIDQILRRPSEPTIYEPVVRDARDYVALAERVHGPIERGVDGSYIWGDAIEVWREYAPDLFVMNLETGVTRSSRAWPEKGIHYRMHPANARVLRLPAEVASGTERSAAAICYTVANNHVMDFGRSGLTETLDTLDDSGCGRCGAGRSEEQAGAPFRVEPEVDGAGTGHHDDMGHRDSTGFHDDTTRRARATHHDDTTHRAGRRAAVIGVGVGDSGIPPEWAAGKPPSSQSRRGARERSGSDTADRGAGVHLIHRLSRTTIDREVARVAALRRHDEITIVSVHWGGNWGWDVPQAHRAFAHALIDRAGVSIIHGHSSHHVKCFEVYHGGLILYGCGDFITDYEGIPGHDAYRPDLSLMYVADIHSGDRSLRALRMVPMRTVRFSLRRAGDSDTHWLARTLNRDGAPFGTRVETHGGEIRWINPD